MTLAAPLPPTIHSASPRSASLWSIVLSGGDGERTRPFITRWLGFHKPKQYCVFSGERSLFQRTLDRTERLTPPSRRIIVAAESHRAEVARQLTGREPGRVVFQPANCGTAPGIFLPLTYARHADRGAVVSLFPSDHFVHPEEGMARAVRRAERFVERTPERIVLLGARPDHAERDYGWIEPMTAPRRPTAAARSVRRFVEKPSLEEARDTLRRGGLWNTFVMVAKASTLWELGRACLPDLMDRFEALASRLGTPAEAETLRDIYRGMPVRDFSSDLLQHVPERLSVMEMPGVLWSDWGRPERIVETLERTGEVPAFPVESLAAV